MIIKALTIENFKGISDPVRVEFKPITLLFGPNSAGKSTIVQALHYAREILEHGNVNADRVSSADDSFDLGGFVNIVHRHDLNLPIKLKFEISLAQLEDYTGYFKDKLNTAWIEYEIKWSNFLDSPLVSSTTVGLDGEFFGTIICAEDGKRARITHLNYEHHLLAISKYEAEGQEHNSSTFLLDLVESVKKDYWSLDSDKLGLFIDQPTALPQFQNLNSEIRAIENDDAHFEDSWEMINDFLRIYFVGVTNVLREELKRFRYIGPIRKTPPRVFSPVRTKDESRWSSGLAAWDKLYTSTPQFIDLVNEWMASDRRLNSGYRIKLKRFKELDIESPEYNALSSESLLDDAENIYNAIENMPEKRRISMIDEVRGVELQPHDIGIGISQVLPVVVATLDGTSGLVMIEQPELHIHPGLQTTLGDLFISQIGSGNKTFLLETHSEHLLLRLLRRIRETNDDELPPDIASLTPEQLSVNYVEPTNSSLRIRQLLVSTDGDSLGEWPKGFFEERAGELY